jgi:hypothetical protein
MSVYYTEYIAYQIYSNANTMQLLLDIARTILRALVDSGSIHTAEHLLDEWCWVNSLHLDTVNRRNYAAFQLRAWCD